MKSKLIIYSFLVFTIFSCQKEIEFKGDTEDSYLVVNGMIEADSTIMISLSKSKPAIGEQNTGPDEITSGASLILVDKTTGQTFISNQVNSQGYYSFNTNAIAGHSYDITINHTDFLTCTSSTTIPSAVAIESWDTLGISQLNNQSLKQVTINWNDPSEVNYYIVKLFAVDTLTSLDESIYLMIEDTKEYDFEGGTALALDDKLFNGKSKQLKLNFNRSYYFDNITGQYLGEKSYKLVLYNVSEEVYKYVVSTTKAVANNGNFFSEPVKVFTNINNGLGIFGGMNKSTLIIP